MMATITVQIGNSDDKLTQVRWAQFYDETRAAILSAGQVRMFFSGASYPTTKWQNACFVFWLPDEEIENMKQRMVALCTKFEQESIAWTEGRVLFLTPK